MTIARRLTPEWLDSLPPEDARARASRRDLARINAVMGSPGIMARLLVDAIGNRPPPRSILEIGCGDGRFMLAVAGRLASRPVPGWRDVGVTLLDRQDIVTTVTSAAFEALGWTTESRICDVFEALDSGTRYDLVLANLFLHHFDDAPLRDLLARLAAAARILVVCEPRRSRVALAGSRLVGLIGCNDVTRHDAVVSVEAGFQDGELSGLWPERAGWVLDEGRAGLFGHRFVARSTGE